MQPEKRFLISPCALKPIPDADQPKWIVAGAVGSQVALFCNGAMVPGTSEYYIRALSANGLKANARKLARDMEEGYLSDVLSPGLSEGAEFVSGKAWPAGTKARSVPISGRCMRWRSSAGFSPRPTPSGGRRKAEVGGSDNRDGVERGECRTSGDKPCPSPFRTKRSPSPRAG